MGKLIALELFNFKSYKGHHVLQFGDSYFTSIIGPNGSGKSNSMDAISFVLGIKSSHLRSTHLKDLVYRGRVLKHSKIDTNGDATNGVANIDLNGDANGHVEAGASEDEEADTQTSTQRNDPTTAWVTAVYEDDGGEEQRWKRSITSSGASEYRINNRVVNAKQYNESLENENILIRARNFLVFQGDVEAIASQSPKDLTRLIEQISGSLEFKTEYDRLKLEKEKADEDQAYRLTQRRGINGEIKQFQQQKEELDKFENKCEEKDQAVVTQTMWKLFHFQRTIEDSAAEIQKHQEEQKESRRNVQKYEERFNEAKQEQARVGRDVSKIERDIKRKEKALQEKENALVPVNEKLELSNKNLKSYQKQVTERTAERDSQQKSADKLQNDLTQTQKAQKRWDDDWRAQQQQAGRELNEDDLQEYRRLRGEVYKRSGSDKSKADNITRQLKTDEETVNNLKSKLDTVQLQANALDAETKDLSQRHTEVNQTIKSTTKDVDVKKKDINAVASERERNRQKHTELDEKLRQVLMRLDEAQGMQRESRKETQTRETVSQMKRIFPGVKGMVHQLCKPKQKKYDTAVATALGRDWDSVIVESEKVAKDCIEYLKEQRIGQMRFIPLDTVIHTQPNANLRGMYQGMRLAIDTIDYDASLERAMSCACGNAIVTDTLQIARHLCYERKVDAKAVTLDGTVIHKGGNLTGGEGLNDKKRRFEETEVENLRTLASKFKGDIDALPKAHKNQAEEEKLQSELTGLEAKLKYYQDELKALDRNIESKSKELDFARSQLAEVQPKYDEQSRGVESLREELESFTEAIGGVEDEVFGVFCQRLGYRNIREYEKQQGSLQEEARQKQTEFKRHISRLQNSLNFEQQRVQSTQDRLTKIEAQMARDQDTIAALQEQKVEFEGELDELNAEVEQLGQQHTTIKSKYEEHGTKVNEARAEVQKRSKSLEKTKAAIAELETDVQTASTSRYTILRQCKVENVDLPLERGSRKIDALPNEGTVLGQDEDAMDVDGDENSNRPQHDDYGIHIDFSALDDELKQDDSPDMEATLAETIHTLTADLEKMAPNMRSAERLEATSDRLKATERDFTTARTTAKEATKAFDRVRQKRQDHFNKAFQHISDQIGPVYRELTKTVSFPLGGSASLACEDDDEPYLSGVRYHAMPPLKRFRDMEHLSGGEKTMAALALLFAVHTYAPSPFFVLDEVDAALDNANTAQLANYVKEHAGPGMQFVVISLKTGLFQNSETLVGVMRDQEVNSSRALTLDVSSLLFS